MTLYWNQFRALLWKEYRECRPLFWLSLPLAFIIPSWYMPYVLYQDSHRYMHDVGGNISMLYGFQITYIIGLAFVLFLPLLSREPERDNLVCLNLKPISPEYLCFMQWLSGFAIALAGLVFSASYVHIVFCGASFWKLLFGVIFIFITASMCFFTLSSFTGNRLRSFGLLLLVVPTYLFLSSYIWEISRLYDFEFGRSIYYFGEINPWLSFGIRALVLAVLASAVLRIRMTQRLSNWKVYACVFTALVIFYFASVSINNSNSNAKMAAIVIDGKVATNEGFALPLPETPSDDPTLLWVLRNGPSSGYMDARHKLPDGGFKPYSAHIAGETLRDYQYSNTPWRVYKPMSELEPSRFVILQCDKYGSASTFFEQPLELLFNAHLFDAEVRERMETFNVWKNANAWRLFESSKGGLLCSNGTFTVDLLREYMREYGGDEMEFREIWQPDLEEIDGETVIRETPFTYRQIKEKFQHFFDYVEQRGGPVFDESIFNHSPFYHPVIQTQMLLIGHFSYDETPRFTPIKKFDFQYKKGDEWVQETIEAAQPGYFTAESFEGKFKGLPVHTRVDQNGETVFIYSEDEYLELPPEYREDLSNAGNAALWLQRGFFWNFRQGDSVDDYRTFSLEAYNKKDGSGHFNLKRYDFSDPGVLRVSVGCQLLKPLPRIMNGDNYPRDLAIAIDGDRMAVSYNTEWSEYLSVFDINDTMQIKEISRQKNPWLRQLSNWHYGSTVFDNGLLYAKYSDSLYVYEWQNDKRFTPYARIMNTQFYSKNIKDYWIRENEQGERSILLMDDSRIRQYGIGPNQSLNTTNASTVDIYNLPGYIGLIQYVEKIRKEEHNGEEGGAS